jgi:hypothetical protein
MKKILTLIILISLLCGCLGKDNFNGDIKNSSFFGINVLYGNITNSSNLELMFL